MGGQRITTTDAALPTLMNLFSRGQKGKLADMTVLSADIMKIPVAQIPKTRCLLTIIGGEIAYDGRSTTAK